MTAPEKAIIWGADSAPMFEAWRQPDGEWRWRRPGDTSTHVHLSSCADALREMARDLESTS